MVIVGSVGIALAPQIHTSSVVSAGMPPINTVGLPVGKGVTAWGGGGLPG